METYTVLIIDDDRALRRVVTEALEFLDLDILQADCAKSALEVLGRHSKVDLILLDVFMPGIDGMEFLKQLKHHETYKNIPVIMLTAAVDKTHMLDAVRGGARHYLTKPFNSEDLLTRVVQVLGLEAV